MEKYGDKAFMPQQFNPANPEIRKTTAEEIWSGMGDKWTTCCGSHTEVP